MAQDFFTILDSFTRPAVLSRTAGRVKVERVNRSTTTEERDRVKCGTGRAVLSAINTRPPNGILVAMAFIPRAHTAPALAPALAGLASSLAAALVFATAHALIIVPIWNRVAGGVALAAIAGAGCGQAFSVMHPDATHHGMKRAMQLGARYGAHLWLAVAPVSLADALLRAGGVARRYDPLADIVAVLLALAGGWTLGHRVRGTRRAAVWGALATLLLTCAMGGPVPIARNVRALGIWLAVLPACVVAGSTLGAVLTWWECRAAPSSPPSCSEPGSA